MCRCARYAVLLLLCLTLFADAGEQKWTELSTSLDPWKGRTEGWIFADSVTLDAKEPAQAERASRQGDPRQRPRPARPTSSAKKPGAITRCTSSSSSPSARTRA